MIEPDKSRFLELAREGNLVPVHTRILHDLDTPVSAYMTLARSRESFLLESVEGGDAIGRYSFLGIDPITVVKGKSGHATIRTGAETRDVEYGRDPLRLLEELFAGQRPAPDPSLPPFVGGAVGYLSYDVVRDFERLPSVNADDLDLPDFYFMFPEIVVVFDRVTNMLTIGTYARVNGDPEAAWERATRKVAQIANELQTSTVKRPVRRGAPFGDEGVRSTFDKPGFMDAVERCREYIRAGDILQAVLSQRFEVDFEGDPFDLYRSLRTTNPSPYMFYLNFEDLKLIGASPEVHVKVESGRVTLRPIAGTRRRGKDSREDAERARDLLADEKERAEHVMLVDLGRNDLSRVCEPGSVEVTQFMTVEHYSHVMHIVSNVEGRLREGRNAFDAIRATFPAGTVSGAPKVRAMEIIEELEPVRRGPYAGIVGYFSNSGNLNSCITIRTILVKGDRAYIQAGAGIVADSDPESEYEETRNKAMVLLGAAGHVERR